MLFRTSTVEKPCFLLQPTGMGFCRSPIVFGSEHFLCNLSMEMFVPLSLSTHTCGSSSICATLLMISASAAHLNEICHAYIERFVSVRTTVSESGKNRQRKRSCKKHGNKVLIFPEFCDIIPNRIAPRLTEHSALFRYSKEGFSSLTRFSTTSAVREEKLQTAGLLKMFFIAPQDGSNVMKAFSGVAIMLEMHQWVSE
ncbi:hypothetical protein CEXT_173981 [Caerostris extrusa]|uniref:Uncharacterized protein n=1 Tax=Caerostris extrusa TaxID=172846 RepID=A0AAV4R8Q8_CAEEX|nr:hypothetical protein CEXT_173981 [Caerostris extrusa]